jgi:hypothetical protein
VRDEGDQDREDGEAGGGCHALENGEWG